MERCSFIVLLALATVCSAQIWRRQQGSEESLKHFREFSNSQPQYAGRGPGVPLGDVRPEENIEPESPDAEREPVPEADVEPAPAAEESQGQNIIQKL
ncbi:hypothetical protein L9F63_000313 [Diploptera punctata]|uniref:Uncharacterized protein n=1 Tax=Diploptera punctata TaxID=6984 RepID=A0AAD8ESI3_DIPPU|nr:hypothetical protein L9F63_000313 [Diploptera punctata]